LETPPPVVLGSWTSSDARYVGREIRISAQEVVIGRGDEGPPSRGTLTSIWSWEESGSQVILLQYLTEDGEEELEIVLDSRSRMHLRNPADVIWTRR
jgi:hypothetical protein